MKRSIIIFVAFCAGCATQPPAFTPSNPEPAARAARALSSYWNYAIVHSFGNHNSGGKQPYSGVLVYKGKFYGTLSQGGGTHKDPALGRLFEISPNGHERVLHDFLPGSGGVGTNPEGGVTEFNGTLYGTTTYGGGGTCAVNGQEVGCGTIFSISLSGANFQTLHEFTGTDGQWPNSNLTVFNGTLYGTTLYGGKNSYGTVFAVSPSGGFKTLHDFQGGSDGARPSGPLTVMKGKMYGTTLNGGGAGAGVVFSITVGGSEHILYRCKGAPDCDSPTGGVTALNGKLYGNSIDGGSGGGSGGGTVFVVTTGGDEQILHSFSFSDGANPYASLAIHDGVLYGTTVGGGQHDLGVVFSITPTGSFEKLYDFIGPYVAIPSGLTYFDGKLYGTLPYGGDHPKGGVLYSLTP